LEQDAGKYSDQWSAEDMLDDLTAAAAAKTSGKVRFIGITANNLFMKDTSYVFGCAQGKCAVVSYRQFLASFTGEVSSRARLLRRFHCLCVAQAAHVFGLPQSTDPISPRCYVHSLEEVDAKTDHLSEASRKEFADVFSKL
jgi:predicted Zn-dependent protease